MKTLSLLLLISLLGLTSAGVILHNIRDFLHYQMFGHDLHAHGNQNFMNHPYHIRPTQRPRGLPYAARTMESNLEPDDVEAEGETELIKEQINMENSDVHLGNNMNQIWNVNNIAPTPSTSNDISSSAGDATTDDDLNPLDSVISE